MLYYLWLHFHDETLDISSVGQIYRVSVSVRGDRRFVPRYTVNFPVLRLVKLTQIAADEARSAGYENSPRQRTYVPACQDLRYFSCSSVSVSISTPIEASFRRATCWSISGGTG